MVAILSLFTENDMDGDALMTLVSMSAGADCLKELIPSVGARMKVYKHIKACYNKDMVWHIYIAVVAI